MRSHSFSEAPSLLSGFSHSLPPIGAMSIKSAATVLLFFFFFPFLHGALAADPVPDRPTRTSSAYLVAPRSVELELGTRWADVPSVPARFKYAIGQVLEPRLYMDLAGIDSGHPRLRLEGKVGLFRRQDSAFSLLFTSTTPADLDTPWSGQALALTTVSLRPVHLSFNAGLVFEGRGDDAIGLAGVPLSLALGSRMPGPFSWFGESAVVVDGGARDWLAELGLRMAATGIIDLDFGLGWSQSMDSIFVDLGFTANVGTLALPG